VESLELVVSRSASGAYRTISAAVEAAAEQRRPCKVRIEQGRYEEIIELRGELTLYALEDLGSVRIQAPTNAAGPTITSHGTLVLTGLELFSQTSTALSVLAGTVKVDRCHLETRAGKGIVSAVARSGSKLTLTSCSVTGGGLWGQRAQLSVAGCTITQIDQVAVCQSDYGTLEVTDTTITSAGTNAINVTDNCSATIRNCSIRDTGGSAVCFANSAKGLIVQSKIERSGDTGVIIR